MQKRGQVTIFLVAVAFAILLFGMALAQDPLEPNYPEYEKWNDPTHYNNLDWGTVQDWNSVQWDKVNWEQVNWNQLDSSSLNSILQHQPSLLNDQSFFNRFDEKLTSFSPADFSTISHDTLNTWMEKKSSGQVSMAAGAKLQKYDGENVHTTSAPSTMFNPSELPPGEFEIQADGSLRSKTKFQGRFYGEINYDSEKGVLVSDTQFQDASDNNFKCNGKCRLEVSEDGAVKKLEGEATLVVKSGEKVIAKDLEAISIKEGNIFALPSKEGSILGGTQLFGNSEVSYSPKDKRFQGNDILIKATTNDMRFAGERISFLDEEKSLVATLASGETAFSISGCKSASSAISCISAERKKERLEVNAKRGSIILLDAIGYSQIDVGRITDGSVVALSNGADKVAVFDKQGVHPRMNLKESGLDINYHYQKKSGKSATHHSGTDGDKVCEDEKCSEVNFQCITG